MEDTLHYTRERLAMADARLLYMTKLLLLLRQDESCRLLLEKGVDAVERERHGVCYPLLGWGLVASTRAGYLCGSRPWPFPSQ
jgi:hypothetical protein